eukprot:NODE_4972_length_995_cov_127.083716_g4765_i0.p1 GENE.NODE_4972_length_995_cov_127.083716_g4765_i0~~NODE_4972_length_995_cov_127.083716_g4765_i0.p1  ORF type:complete len:240 (-),score=27.97 NODE_4972_length_995_cov_127.083716_g4765_i0:215-934(-)
MPNNTANNNSNRNNNCEAVENSLIENLSPQTSFDSVRVESNVGDDTFESLSRNISNVSVESIRVYAEPAIAPASTTEQEAEVAPIATFRDFVAQAACGMFIAVFRVTGELPTDENMLTGMLAQYLNTVHGSVLSGDDDYVNSTMLAFPRHSPICVINMAFAMGRVLLNKLTTITFDLVGPPDEVDARVSVLRQIVMQIMKDSAAEMIQNDIFEHECSGPSVEAMRQSGDTTPIFQIVRQ